MGTQAPDHVSSLHLAAGEKNLTELCPRFHSQNHHGYDSLMKDKLYLSHLNVLEQRLLKLGKMIDEFVFFLS